MTTNTEPTLARELGLPGRVTLSWTMAGGLLLGGVLIALMTLSGQMSGHGLFITSTGLFLIGALIGGIHGATLGFFGRPADQDRREALASLGRAALYIVPAAAVAWLVTVWISMSMIALYLERTATQVLVGIAWIAAAGVLSWAAVTGKRALAHAYARWPEKQLGTALVTASFAALLVTFLADLPMIWLIRLRVTEVGAVLLAVFSTIWLAGPLITIALRLAGELPGRPRAALGTSNATRLTDIGLGLLAGAVVGLMAVPFAGPSGMITGTAGGTIVAVAQALVDEVLLRLFLLTAVAWLVLRWHRVHSEEAAVVAVAGVAIAQVLLYLPGVVAAGFPSALAAVSFMAAAVLVPALVFGAMYWTRGFTSALVADATAALALVLLV